MTSNVLTPVKLKLVERQYRSCMYRKTVPRGKKLTIDIITLVLVEFITGMLVYWHQGVCVGIDSKPNVLTLNQWATNWLYRHTNCAVIFLRNIKRMLCYITCFL